MVSHEQHVLGQFDPKAGAYLTSAVHASGPDLLAAREFVAANLPRHARMLDVGCGAGHLGLALAPALGQVTACDPSPSMLAVAAEAARDRGITNLDTARASAASMPFADAAFGLVATRYSAHHWLDVPAALREMRRVVQYGGYLMIIDVLGHRSAVADTHLQAIELLRDPGHVRNHDARQWRTMIEAAGFSMVSETSWKIRLAFDSWIARMNTPPASAAAIRDLQCQAPEEVRSQLGYEPDGSFSPDVGLFVARAGTADCG